MYSISAKIVNSSGLHARPASDFVFAAKRFEARITIRNVDSGAAAVSAKSIVKILAEGMGKGTEVEITADGPDEREAAQALKALIDGGFGEE